MQLFRSFNLFIQKQGCLCIQASLFLWENRGRIIGDKNAGGNHYALYYAARQDRLE